MDDRLIESHFLKLANLVETHTGIRMPPSKRLMLEGRLRRRVRALGLDTLSDYGKAIFHDGRLSEEFEHLVDCVTTNKTDFFREPEHFVFLRDHAIPAALKLKRAPDAPIRLWSAAASIGAEAYSAAMVAADVLGLGGRAFPCSAPTCPPRSSPRRGARSIRARWLTRSRRAFANVS